jgi:hypothetical protein
MSLVECDIVWVGVTYTVRADALHDLAIISPVLWPVTHVMVGNVMDTTSKGSAFLIFGMGIYKVQFSLHKVVAHPGAAPGHRASKARKCKLALFMRGKKIILLRSPY